MTPTDSNNGYIASDGTIDLKERERQNKLKQSLAELIGGLAEFSVNVAGGVLCYRAGIDHGVWSFVYIILGLLLIQTRLKGNYIDDGRNDVYLKFNGHRLGRIFKGK